MLICISIVAKLRKSICMAKKNEIKVKRRGQKVAEQRGWEFPLERKNLMWLGIGLLVIIVGYLLMSTGITEEAAVPDGKWNNPFAITVAPLVLLLGYCVIIPFAIMKNFGKKEEVKSKVEA
jgi:hypothetical protein